LKVELGGTTYTKSQSNLSDWPLRAARSAKGIMQQQVYEPLWLCAYMKRVNVQVFWYTWTGACVHMYGEVNVSVHVGRECWLMNRYTENLLRLECCLLYWRKQLPWEFWKGSSSD
jgi:hypothetical protein